MDSQIMSPLAKAPLEEPPAEAFHSYRARRRPQPRHLLSPGAEAETDSNPLRQTDVLNRLRDPQSGLKYINEYRIIRMIGEGACGKVKLGYNPTESKLVAIKEVHRPVRKTTLGGHNPQQRQYLALKREIAIMKALRHRNIVSVYEVIDDPTASKLYLIMQYIDGGAIASVSVEEGTDIVCTPIEPVQLMIYARQMLSGLEYLHRHNVVHRDIKPDNILVSKSGTVYLADFGVAETFDNHFRERMQNLLQESMMYSMAMSRAGNQPGGPQVLGKKGTLLFMAPELWENQKVYGRPIDMWALGVTLYVLLTGKLPFKNTEDIPDPNKLEVPSDYGEAWQELLLGLLEYDPERRLTVQRARSLVKEMLVALDAEVPNKVEDILQRQRTVAVSISSPAHIAEHVRAPAAPNTMPEARVTTALPAFKLKSAATCGRRPNVNVYSLLNNAS